MDGRQGGASKEESFVDETDIFSPPVPAANLSASVQSNQSDTSTASGVAEELARLRAELEIIEKGGPK